MPELTNIARPYAQAVFELARDSERFDDWSDCLVTLSEIVTHSDVASMIQDPRIDRSLILEIVLEISGDAFDQQVQNFIRILSHYRRLSAVPQIAKQYESLRAEEEGIIEAELETAYPIDEQQQQKIAAALQQRLGRKIRLFSTVDENLIGGAIIRAGDWVVDGSIRARLDKLASSLGV